MPVPEVVVRAGRRLRGGGRYILEATAASTVAWFVAVDLLGHPQPFFAPAAALIVLGQSRGQRVGRSVEILLGVAGGVLAADLVVALLGTRSTAAIVVVVLLVTSTTVALGASGLLAVQAAISGLYVAVIAPQTDSLIPIRFIDALVGGTVALIASQLSRHRSTPPARTSGSTCGAGNGWPRWPRWTPRRSRSTSWCATPGCWPGSVSPCWSTNRVRNPS